MDSKLPGIICKPDSRVKSTCYPGMLGFRTNPDLCCIYRVPDCMRRVNPEAYTPQLLLIGPLNHSLKSQALQSRGDITNAKLMGYLNMEEHKKFYLLEFAKMIEGINDIDGLRKIIEENEEKIRESYSESTAWIKSREFVEMILLDSVFILEFILRCFRRSQGKIGDPLLDNRCLEHAVQGDLILLENQLPYFILEELFAPIIPLLFRNHTFRNFSIDFLGFGDKIGKNSKFKHFTDMVRCVYAETLPVFSLVNIKHIEHMYNADKLASVGVKFEAVEEDFSLNVRFENGCLKMPCLKVEDNLEMRLRNVTAFEQCHDLYNAHVCAYIIFLDHLIDTEKDVDLLVEKGVIKNNIGQHGVVAEMVNTLCLGILGFGSYYPNIAIEINAYYSNPFNKLLAVLKHVFFGNLRTGTGTVAAMCLLFTTLTQAVSSIIQVMEKAP